MSLKQLLWHEVARSQCQRGSLHILWPPSKYIPVSEARSVWSVSHSKCYHMTARALQVNKHKAAEVSKVQAGKDGQITLAEKVKEAGKDATYTGVILFGVGVTGIMFYLIGKELFSGQSPSGLYGKALKKCRNHQEIMDELGDPIKGQGEMNRRGRARFVSHHEFEKDGVKYMRIKFYLKGILRRGTAHLEVKQNDSGKYETRYLFVEVDKYPYKTIIVEDNR